MKKSKLVSGKSRLWIVSELYYPEQTSTGYFLTRIAEGLAATHDVAVVCGQPTYSERGQIAPRTEVRNGVKIFRMMATRYDKDKLPLRLLNSLTLTISVFIFAVLHFKNQDRLLVVTNPPTLVPFLAIVSKIKKQKSFLLVHDVYPDVLSATGVLSRTGIIYRILSSIFNAAYRMFDHIIVLGRDMRELFQSKMGPKIPITIIPNWADLDEIQPILPAQNPFSAAHGLLGKTVIQYSGNMGRTHDIDVVLNAAKVLEHRKDIVFLFVGYGGKSKDLDTIQKQRPGRNVVFLPRQTREMLGAMLASATATVISFVPEMLGVSVPSRMYNILAAGVPIIAIADPSSELWRFVEEHEAGWTIPIGDQGSLVSVITKIADHKNDNAPWMNSRKSVEQNLTFQKVIGQYVSLITNS